MIGNVKGSFVLSVFKYFRNTSANTEDFGATYFIYSIPYCGTSSSVSLLLLLR
jgi:hypothetical protein